MEKDNKYSMLEDILENANEIEKKLNSLKETFKVEGENLDSRLKNQELNVMFMLLNNDLNAIKRITQSVIEHEKLLKQEV